MQLNLKIFILMALVSCVTTTKNEQNFNKENPKSKTDTSFKPKSYYNQYDSLSKVHIDTTLLKGKQQWILNQFLTEYRQTPDYNIPFDLNYDRFEDYTIGYYGQVGTGIKNRVIVYFYDPIKNYYVLNEQLSDLANPTFYINQRKITSFYLAHGGGGGTQLEWIKEKWTITKEFDVDNEGDTTKWKISYPLKKKTEVRIKPYQMIPPQDILETDITLE